MKQFYLVVLLMLLATGSPGQPNTFPDTFPLVKGFKALLVKTDYLCSKTATKNKTTSKYIFDELGHTTEFLSICDNKTCGHHIYTYADNQLISHKNFSSWTPFSNDISESRWDSSLLSNEITFEYNGNQLISYKDYVPEMQNIIFEKKFFYAEDGKILSETTKTYYDSITEKLETIHYALVDVKEYVYNDTVTKIKYYRNSVLTATEEMVNSKGGKPLRQTLKSVKGKILNKNSYKYNEKMQLVEINTLETGYDGFGNTYDGMPYEKTFLKYDTTGKLVSKEQFYRGRLCNREKYEYIK